MVETVELTLSSTEVGRFMLPHAADTCHSWQFQRRSIGQAIGLLPLSAATFGSRRLFAPFTSALSLTFVSGHL